MGGDASSFWDISFLGRSESTETAPKQAWARWAVKQVQPNSMMIISLVLPEEEPLVPADADRDAAFVADAWELLGDWEATL